MLNQLRDLFFRQPQHVVRGLLELFLFVGVDVFPLFFRKAVHKHSALTTPKKEDCTVSARFAVSRSSDSLFDNAAAEVCVHLPFFRTSHRVEQNRVADSFLSGKPLKPSRLEDSRLAGIPHTVIL